jgi:hypothetical protein
MFLLMPPDGFRYTKGAPKQFKPRAAGARAH